MASSFSRQRNPNMEKALFDWPIVLQYDVKEISRKFFGHEVCLPARSLSQPKPRCVCIRFIHQSNRSISVRLLFLFCSRVFISRSYENRSMNTEGTIESVHIKFVDFIEKLYKGFLSPGTVKTVCNNELSVLSWCL